LEKKKIHIISNVELEKAFEQIPHDFIWQPIRAHHIPEAYVQCVQLTSTNITSRVICMVGTSEPFIINVDFHQGSALSPLLFVRFMDSVTADIQNPHPWNLLYADDIMLATETRRELEEVTQQ